MLQYLQFAPPSGFGERGYPCHHAPSRACKHALPGSGRKLKEVFDRDRSEIAAEGLRRITVFDKIKVEIRGTLPGQRLPARQTRTKPLVDDFDLWLRDQRNRISAKSRLGEKLGYLKATLEVITSGHIDDFMPWALNQR